VNAIQVKWALRKYLRRHHITEQPKMNPAIPTWGKAAKANAKRICGSTEMTACWAKVNEVTPASRLRNGIVHGYHSIMGAMQGGSVQRAIAAFCGLSDRQPWCAETFWYVAKHLAGYNGPRPENIAFVPAWELFAEKHHILVAPRYALPGMGCTFVFTGSKGVGRGQHIGVLLKTGILRHKIAYNPTTAEGNASDAVRTETRYWWQINTVFDIGRLQK